MIHTTEPAPQVEVLFTQAAECLRNLAHPSRLQMVDLMLQGRYTVGELAQACGIPSHMASEHLRLMKMCGFLSCTREGRKTYYEVAEPHLASLMDCIRKRFGKPTATASLSAENFEKVVPSHV